MKIDYSIEQNSKYLLFVDVPFRQGLNHINLAIKDNNYGLFLSEKIKHIAIGILKFIPVLGHAIALVDTMCQRNIVQLKLKSTHPFERGEEHGRILKKRIKEVYDPILAMKHNDLDLRKKSADFEEQIPEHLKLEMRGLAKGSGYSYRDVLLIHTFLDAQPGQFGCTSMAVKETAKNCLRIAAANHSLIELTANKDSKSRRIAFLGQSIPENGSVNKVVKAAGKDSTIQAMVFDTIKGEISLSAGGSYATNGKFRTFGPNSLFTSHKFSHINSDSRVLLFRNLDWPWYFLGQETIVLTRPHANGHSTVSVSWPGYIGTLSGINDSGLALTENQCGNGINLKGIPNPLLFTDILDTYKSVKEASQVIENGIHGSSMNLVIADKISAKSYELKGDGIVFCVGEIK